MILMLMAYEVQLRIQRPAFIRSYAAMRGSNTINRPKACSPSSNETPAESLLFGTVAHPVLRASPPRETGACHRPTILHPHHRVTWSTAPTFFTSPTAPTMDPCTPHDPHNPHSPARAASGQRLAHGLRELFWQARCGGQCGVETQVERLGETRQGVAKREADRHVWNAR